MDSGASRPRWSVGFPLAAAAAVLLGVIADFRLFGFDGAVFAGHDKVLHFALYGGCAFLAVGWFHDRKPLDVLAATSVLVILEELSQGLFSHRSLDLFDVISSVAGIFVCGGLAWWISLMRRASVEG